MLPVALTLSDLIEKGGAYAGLAAFFGFAVLAVLHFANARELKRLREWAGRAPERAQELEQRVMAQAEEARRVKAQPAAVPATAAAKAAPAQAAASPATAAATAASAGKGAQTTAPAAATAPEKAATEVAAAAGNGAATPAAATAATGAGPAAATAAAGGPPASTSSGAAAPDAPASGAAPGSPPASTSSGAGAQPAARAGGADPAEAPTTAVPAVPAAPNGAAGAEPAGPPPSRPVPPPRPGQPPRRPAPTVGSAPVRPGATTSARPPVRRPGTPAPAASGDGRRRGVLTLVFGAVALGLAALAVITFLGGGDPEPQPAASPAADPAVTAEATADAEQPATLSREDTTVVVLNGTTITGLAASVTERIEAAGFTTGSPDTYTDQARSASVVFYADNGARRQALDVAEALDITDVEPMIDAAGQLAPDADVVVVVGADQSP